MANERLKSFADKVCNRRKEIVYKWMRECGQLAMSELPPPSNIPANQPIMHDGHEILYQFKEINNYCDTEYHRLYINDRQCGQTLEITHMPEYKNGKYIVALKIKKVNCNGN